MEPRIEQKLELTNAEYLNILYWLKNKGSEIMYPRRIICSRYFDTYDLMMYNNTLEGITPRKKIRIRTYNSWIFENSKNSFNFEIKKTTKKNRYKSIQKNIDIENFIKNGIYDDLYGLCRPKVDISYEREYFNLDGIRITIDKNINYKMISNNGLKPLLKTVDKLNVLEIKADISNNINELANKFEFPRTRFSKYERAIQLLEIE
tara:strand:+ start:7257 stop:7871 length:615 start_codon:yes stop_codon:yes gene_type:complete